MWIYLPSKKETRHGKQCLFYDTKTQCAAAGHSVISEQAETKRKIQTGQLRLNIKRTAWKPRLEPKNGATELSGKNVCNIWVAIFGLAQPDFEKSDF